MANAGVPHVVAVESGTEVSGTTETLYYPAFPVISIISSETNYVKNRLVLDISAVLQKRVPCGLLQNFNRCAC